MAESKKGAFEGVVEQLVADIKDDVLKSLTKELRSHDHTIKELVQAAEKKALAQLRKKLNDDLSSMSLSGNEITGGIIEKFASTGIQDLAKETQLTVLDDMIVVENELVTQSLVVKQDTVIEGDLTVLGNFPLNDSTQKDLITKIGNIVHKQVSEEIQANMSEAILTEIGKAELDVSSLLIKGKQLINGSSLAPFIKDSRLTTVGTLKNLLVKGEAQIYDTFYVGNKRVGINTQEPAAALTVRDEEVEIVAGKHSKDRSYLGTLRAQEVILGAHNKENIIMAINGVTGIQQLIADKTGFCSAEAAPNFESTAGTVCFNTKPDIGAPYGWMCLGGARWGIMGIIE